MYPSRFAMSAIKRRTGKIEDQPREKPLKSRKSCCEEPRPWASGRTLTEAQRERKREVDRIAHRHKRQRNAERIAALEAKVHSLVAETACQSSLTEGIGKNISDGSILASGSPPTIPLPGMPLTDGHVDTRRGLDSRPANDGHSPLSRRTSTDEHITPGQCAGSGDWL